MVGGNNFTCEVRRVKKTPAHQKRITFMPEPIPPTNCPNCQSPIRFIRAGISKKTGKPYSEFWSCENRDCSFTWRPDRPKSAEKPIDNTEELIFRQQMKEGLKIINENIQKIIEMLKEK